MKIENYSSRLLVFIILSCVFVLYSCGNGQDKAKTEEGEMRQSAQQVQTEEVPLDTTNNQIQDTLPVKKINKKNLVIKEWNTNVLTNTKMLDHVTTYDPNGKKIEEIEYNSEGQKWRERYEYDSKGNKTRELVYNNNNKLVYVKKYEYNEYGQKKMTYTYNAQGKLIGLKNYEYIAQ